MILHITHNHFPHKFRFGIAFSLLYVYIKMERWQEPHTHTREPPRLLCSSPIPEPVFPFRPPVNKLNLPTTLSPVKLQTRNIPHELQLWSCSDPVVELTQILTLVYFPSSKTSTPRKRSVAQYIPGVKKKG